MIGVVVAMSVAIAQADEPKVLDVNHERDIVYGYKDGMALVMDCYVPQRDRNRACVILVMSGGLYSSPNWSHQAGQGANVMSLLEAGYVVCAVAHGSQPKYTIDEILPDISRAVRFVRHSAVRFGIEPQRIGAMGYSSGGFLSLYAATAPVAENPLAEDPVDRESSRLQAVVAYFPGTDLLNFGSENESAIQRFPSQLDFHAWDDNTKRLERISDPEKQRQICRTCSPITHVSPVTPPVLIFHGDQDELVPLQQSERFVARLRDAGVTHKLIVVQGEKHGWPAPVDGEMEELLGWFNQHLLTDRK